MAMKKSNLFKNLVLSSVENLGNSNLKNQAEQLIDEIVVKEDGVFNFGNKKYNYKLDGKEYNSVLLWRSFQEQWGQYFGDGRFNNDIFDLYNISPSDRSYLVLTLESSATIVPIVYDISRDLLGAFYKRSAFDCDDFARLIAGLFSLVLSKISGHELGSPVGVLHLDYIRPDGKHAGHALNAMATNNNKPEWFLYESQSTSIFPIEQYGDVQIHQFSM